MKGCFKFLFICLVGGGLLVAFGIHKVGQIPPAQLTPIEKEIGEKPIVIGNSPPATVKRYFKENVPLKDPVSLRFDKVSSPVVAEYGGKRCWMISVQYAAKNSFGGFTENAAVLYIEHGSVIGAKAL